MTTTQVALDGRYVGPCTCGCINIAIDAGAAGERAAIVAWLRQHDVVETGGAFADYIEHGDHLRGDDA